MMSKNKTLKEIEQLMLGMKEQLEKFTKLMDECCGNLGLPSAAEEDEQPHIGEMWPSNDIAVYYDNKTIPGCYYVVGLRTIDSTSMRNPVYKCWEGSSCKPINKFDTYRRLKEDDEVCR